VLHQLAGVYDEFKPEDMSSCKKLYFALKFGLHVAKEKIFLTHL
jgi:hypothetical protein